MANISLSAKTRTVTGHKVGTLRADGQLPVVLYGHGVDTQSLQVDAKKFAKLYREAGSSTIIELDIDGKMQNVVVHDIQFDPVTEAIVHADLYQVKMDEKLTAEVPLVFKGVSAAVKDLGGMLIKSVDKLEVEALPKDLPHEITVNISTLEGFDNKISLSDLEIPAGVEVKEEREITIVSVEAPRTEEELAALDEAVTEDVEAVEGVTKETDGEDVTEGEDGEKAKDEKGAEDKPEADAEKPDKSEKPSSKEDK